MTYKAIGAMCGSSMDGLDLVAVELTKHDRWLYQVTCTKSVSYTEEVKKLLDNVVNVDGQQLIKSDHEFGAFLGSSIKQFVEEHELFDADVVGVHGHTVYHEPAAGYSTQIGNGQQIAHITQLKTVVDFRNKDILHGGQGAPLVPFGEKYLFTDHSIFLNLGGIANISFHDHEAVTAYDICGTNQLLNHYAQLDEMPYDVDGNLARSGRLQEPLLKFLSHWYYYKKDAPKSLSNQQVQDIIPQIDQFGFSIADVLHTLVEHIAQQISKEVILYFAKKRVNPEGTMCISGGGAFNKFLIEKLMEHSSIDIYLPSKEFIEFKEAIVFAFLAVKRLLNEPNCLASVTGAEKDIGGGVLYYP